MYLTFDDGPVPGVTEKVLDTLAKYNAKATFFCVGDNIAKNPEIYERIIREGHSVGSHTFNHLNGWQNENIPYYHNVRKAASLVKTDLFRPPYGRLKPRQAQFLMRHYKIIMWDVLSGDFDKRISKEQCAQNVIRNARPGSIIVFHDSLKAADNVLHALPEVLKYFTQKGIEFSNLQEAFQEQIKATAQPA